MGFLESAAVRRTVENFIVTPSPYGLQKPPEWFLDELYAHDPQLVIFASLDQPVYRVMRRMTVSQPWTVFLKHKPDTAIAGRFNLYPVTSVNPSVLLGFSWARVLLDLQERDQWQFRDATAVSARIEGAEAAQERRLILSQADEADMRSIDFYRAYNGMNGSRTSLAYRAPDGARSRNLSARPRRAYRPQNAGAGAFFTGRQRGAVRPAGRQPGALVTGGYR